MTTIERLLEKLAGFEQRRRAIEIDGDLNFEAKTRRLQELEREKATLKAEVWAAFRDGWAELYRRSKRLEVEQHAADESAARLWDYERLGFAARQVEGAVSGAFAEPMKGITALQSVERLWDVANRSGDNHLRRAWAQIGAAQVRARFGEAGAPLAARMESALQELMSTPELKAVEAQDKRLCDDTLAMLEQTERAANSFLEDRQFVLNEDIRKLADGIVVHRQVDAPAGRVKIDVEFVQARMSKAVTERSLLP